MASTIHHRWTSLNIYIYVYYIDVYEYCMYMYMYILYHYRCICILYTYMAMGQNLWCHIWVVIHIHKSHQFWCSPGLRLVLTQSHISHLYFTPSLWMLYHDLVFSHGHEASMATEDQLVESSHGWRQGVSGSSSSVSLVKQEFYLWWILMDWCTSWFIMVYSLLLFSTQDWNTLDVAK